jgi:hypothetical protein
MAALRALTDENQHTIKGKHKTGRIISITIVLIAIICAILVGVYDSPASPNGNMATTPSAAMQGTAGQAVGPSTVPDGTIYGHVYLNGTPVEDAKVIAISADGNYTLQDTTNSNGTYVIHAPRGLQFNITASYAWMRHTIWPVFAGEEYDINIYTTQKTLITGKGRVAGGIPGYNASLYNFTAVVIEAVPLNSTQSNATISTKANRDGSYALEVRPGTTYQLKGGMLTTLWFNYHNMEKGGQMLEIKPGPDETALIDYVVLI